MLLLSFQELNRSKNIVTRVWMIKRKEDNFLGKEAPSLIGIYAQKIDNYY